MRRYLPALGLLSMLGGAAMAAPVSLSHGVGLHEWLNWSPLAADGSYRWPPYRSAEEWLTQYRPLADWPAGNEFERIRAMGFDFVRLTVDPGPLLGSDGVRRQEALAVLAAAVRQLTAAGLNVVFNLHAVSQVPAFGKDVVNGAAGSDGIARYVGMLGEVTRMLVPLGTDRVAFEPYNEPAHYPCGADGDGDWQKIMAQSVAAIRAISSEITIVATGACGGSVDGLVDLDPGFDDQNLLYSFHMYEPHLFTHQRSDTEGGFASGLPWPASAGSPEAVVAMLRAHMDAAGFGEADQARNLQAVGGAVEAYFGEGWGRAQLEARIDEALDWAGMHGIPESRLFMGEFGAILMSPDGRSGAFDADRLRYLAAARQVAEQHSIPWSVWEYSNPFGMSVIVPDGPAAPDLALLGALGLRQ